jgi:hypothetical protein
VELADAHRALRRGLALEHAHEADVAQPFAGDIHQLEQARQAVAGHADLGADRLGQRVSLETFGRLRRSHLERAPRDHTGKLGQCSHVQPTAIMEMKKAVAR